MDRGLGIERNWAEERKGKSWRICAQLLEAPEEIKFFVQLVGPTSCQRGHEEEEGF